MADVKEPESVHGIVYAKCRSAMVDGLSPIVLNDRRREVADGRLERLPILHYRDSRQPLVSKNVYMLARRSAITGESLVKEGRHLAHISWWEVACMPDFDSQLLAGAIPDINLVVNSLIPWLRIPSPGCRNARKAFFVTPNVFSERLRALRDYVGQHLDLYMLRPSLSSREVERCRTQKEAFEKVLFQKKLGYQDAEQRYGLTDEEMDMVCSASVPASQDNPWRGFICQQRNRTMVHLFFETGIRAGELGNLYTDDVLRVGKGAFIRVLKRPDDALDPRVRQPQVKTGPRAIPISDELWMMLDDYIMNVRPLTPRAQMYPHLFVSSRTGMPLGLDAIEDAFSGLGRFLMQPTYPHIARHTFTTNLKKRMREGGVSEAKIKENLMSANGWHDERTPKRYTQRDVDESRIELTREYQSTVFKR